MQEPGRARVRELEGTARHGYGMGQESRKVHEPGRVHECGRVQETGRGQLDMGIRGAWLWHGTGRVRGLGVLEPGRVQEPGRAEGSGMGQESGKGQEPRR